MRLGRLLNGVYCWSACQFHKALLYHWGLWMLPYFNGFKYLYVGIHDIMAQRALLILTFSCSKFFTVKDTLHSRASVVVVPEHLWRLINLDKSKVSSLRGMIFLGRAFEFTCVTSLEPLVHDGETQSDFASSLLDLRTLSIPVFLERVFVISSVDCHFFSLCSQKNLSVSKWASQWD